MFCAMNVIPQPQKINLSFHKEKVRGILIWSIDIFHESLKVFEINFL